MSGIPALARLRVPRPTPGLFFRSGPRPAGLGPETTLLSPPLLRRLPRNLRPSLCRHGFGALAAALAPQLNGGGALLGGTLELFSLFARGDLGHTMALPITSAGRLSPLEPLGINMAPAGRYAYHKRPPSTTKPYPSEAARPM